MPSGKQIAGEFRAGLFQPLAVQQLPNKHLNEHVGQGCIRDLHEQGYAARTIHGVHSVLSSILGEAVQWDYLGENPAHRVELPQLVPVRSKWVLSVAAARQLLDALPWLPRTMVGLAILTGMRRGELFALRWENFNEAAGLLAVTASVYRGRFGTPKTAKGRRQLPVSAAALGLLRNWRQKAPQTGPEDPVFGARTGKSSLRTTFSIGIYIRPAMLWACPGRRG